MRLRKFNVSWSGGELAGRWALLILILLFFSLQRGYFIPEQQFVSLFSQAEVFALVALGLTLPMIAGELDLSVGSMAALASVVAIQLGAIGVVPSIILAIALAGTLGAMQGLAIGKLGINSLVFTVSTLIGFRGLAYLASSWDRGTEGSVMQPVDQMMRNVELFSRTFGFLRITGIITLAAFILVAWFLARTRYGREVYAIGGAREEARVAGISRTRPLVISFMLSGACAGAAGALAAYAGGSADPKLFESQLILGLTAALVGGISAFGGRGTVGGVLAGVLIVAAVRSGMQDLAMANYATDIAMGLLLSVFLVLELLRARAQKARLRERATRFSTA